MLVIILKILLILFCFVLFIRWFERYHLYFPSKQIAYTPKDVGLEYEDISFKTQDGKALNGWFVLARPARATILYCHGNGGNISHRIDIIKMFNEMHLNVFIFDYRGYGKSKGSPSEKGTYLDVQAAYNYVISRKDVDKNKIVGYGESLGGAVILDLATKKDLCAIITEGTFASTEDMAKRLFPMLPLQYLISMRYDAVGKIKTINIPKLIIHSIDDEIVPFEHGKILYEAARQPKEFYKMRGGHNEALFISGNDFIKRIDGFIQKALLSQP